MTTPRIEEKTDWIKKWQAKYEIHPTDLAEIYDDLYPQAHQGGLDEARKTILHQLECHIDNVKYAPSKPSDYRAWQDGFMEAYQQARKVIQYGHTKVKALNDTIKALQDNK